MDDNENLEIYENENVNENIANICKKRGITDKIIIGKIVDLVKQQIASLKVQ